MTQQIYGDNWKTLNKWKTNMEKVLPSVEHEEYLSTILIGNLKQIYSLKEVKDFTSLHYIYKQVLGRGQDSTSFCHK